jgi:hypothetical protein
MFGWNEIKERIEESRRKYYENILKSIFHKPSPLPPSHSIPNIPFFFFFFFFYIYKRGKTLLIEMCNEESQGEPEHT